ncbi:hypothetical protein GCM10029976_053230 [Kribbella albertanoniae]
MTSQPEPRDGEMIRTTFDAVTEELEPGVLLVRLSGELDIATTDFASESIRAAVAPPARLVLIDVSAVTFLSSAGLGNLVEARTLAGTTSPWPWSASAVRSIAHSRSPVWVASSASSPRRPKRSPSSEFHGLPVATPASGVPHHCLER